MEISNKLMATLKIHNHQTMLRSDRGMRLSNADDLQFAELFPQEFKRLNKLKKMRVKTVAN